MSDLPDRNDPAALDTSRGGRSTVAVTPHYLASAAAVDVINQGGNAVDGAVAANAVLGVVLPDTCGIGGDLFALIHSPATAVPAALNASGRCGSGWSSRTLRDQGHVEVPPHHPAAVTIPGCVDGWEALLTRFGSQELGTVLEPAIRLARQGFPTSPELAVELQHLEQALADQQSASALYPRSRPPGAGDTLTRADLARTLEAIADDGRTAFYQGSVGAAICRATNHAIRPGDLAEPQADWVEPLSVEVFGHTGWTMPPNSQGYLTLAALWIFEQLDPPRDPTSPGYRHTLIEACRSVAWERDELVHDPNSAEASTEDLLAPGRLRARMKSISTERSGHWPAPREAPGGTAYLCVLDGEGVGVSLIQSNYHGIGSRISAGDTGVFLHNRGAGFNLTSGHPNELAPGKRPLHTLSPTLWTRGDELRLLLGTRGGQYQPQILAQVAAHLLWAGQSAQQAQRQPRWLVDGWQAGRRHRILLEQRDAASDLTGLRKLGHDVMGVDPWQEDWGPVSLILANVDGATGHADPRVSTTAAIDS